MFSLPTEETIMFGIIHLASTARSNEHRTDL